MANDTKGNAINISGMLATVKPTELGKPKKDLSLAVAKASAQLFRVENDKVKIPRKRATSDQWPEWFAELEAPTMHYYFVKSENEGIPVTWDESAELFTDADGNQYTGENVVEMAQPDAREVAGTPDALVALRNAITRFNTKTGKKLATRFVKAQRDSSGRTIHQTEMVYRVK